MDLHLLPTDHSSREKFMQMEEDELKWDEERAEDQEAPGRCDRAEGQEGAARALKVLGPVRR